MTPTTRQPGVDEMCRCCLQFASGRQVVAILGDMLELGDESASYHEDVGRYVADRGVAALVAMGPMAKHLAAGRWRRHAGRIRSYTLMPPGGCDPRGSHGRLR